MCFHVEIKKKAITTFLLKHTLSRDLNTAVSDIRKLNEQRLELAHAFTLAHKNITYESEFLQTFSCVLGMMVVVVERGGWGGEGGG